MENKVLPSIVYTSEPALRHPLQIVREMFRDLHTSRELAWRLALRDLRAQYRQTALGVVWAFIMPAAHAAIWVFMQASGVVAIRDTGMSYAAFVFTGTMLWFILSDAVGAPLHQALAARAMLAKINFPREALILSGAYQVLFHGAIRIVVLIPALWLVGVPPAWTLVLAPLVVLALVLAGTALGVAVTPVGLLYGDIGRALPLLMQFLMFLSPVVYPVPRGGWVATLLEGNPLTPLIAGGRAVLAGQSLDALVPFVLVTLGAVALLFVAWLAYRVAMPILIERMSA